MTPAETLANEILRAVAAFSDLKKPYHVTLARLGKAIEEYEESK